MTNSEGARTCDVEIKSVTGWKVCGRPATSTRPSNYIPSGLDICQRHAIAATHTVPPHQGETP